MIVILHAIVNKYDWFPDMAQAHPPIPFPPSSDNIMKGTTILRERINMDFAMVFSGRNSYQILFEI